MEKFSGRIMSIILVVVVVITAYAAADGLLGDDETGVVISNSVSIIPMEEPEGEAIDEAVPEVQANNEFAPVEEPDTAVETEPAILPEEVSEIAPETEPEVAPEADTEPEVNGEVIPEVEPEAESITDTEPEMTDEAVPEVEPEAEPITETEPEATGEVVPEVEPEAEPVTETEPEATAEVVPEVEPEAELVTETEPEATAEVIPSNDEELEQVQPDVNMIDVREAADGRSAIILSIPEDEEVTIIAVEGQWYRVQVAGVTGYIFGGDIAGDETHQIDTSGMSVTVFSDAKVNMSIGDSVNLFIRTTGLDGYRLSYQWYVDKGDGYGFVPVEGATGDTVTFVATRETLSYDWQIVVDVEE